MSGGHGPEAPPPRGIPAGTRALHILLLSGVGIAQPLYDLLGRNPSFFVAHSATAVDLAVFTVLVSLALPAALWSVQAMVTRLSRGIGSAVYLVLVGALFAIIAAVPVKRLIPSSGWAAVVVALAIGIAAAVAYNRFSALRSVMSALSPSALVFPVLLIFFSGASEIVRDGSEIPAETTGPASTTSVVLIVLDELPVTSLMNGDRLIDPVAFPNFAELAAHADWFRNAVTVAQNTSYAVPAILTGRYPETSCAPHAAAYPENLFSFLAGSYELRAVETFTRLCPDEINAALVEREPLGRRLEAALIDASVVSLHILLPTTLASGLPAIDATWRDFGREGRDREIEDPHAHSHDSTWVADRFLRTLASVDRPTLFFVHLNLPHLPWQYLPSGREYTVRGAPLRPHGLQGEMWGAQEWEVIQGWQRHLLQLAYADRLLGRIITRLRRTGLWDEALIIVTADHGASFQPGESRRSTTAENAADVLGVPMLIKLPGRNDPQIHDENARTIDILATIADVLDADLPWAVDGRSLYAGPSERPEAIVIYRNKGAELEDRLELPNRPEDKYSTLDRKLAIFGAGAPIETLYSIGDFGRLVGRRISELGAAPAPGITVTLNDAWNYDDVDPDSTFVPAQITGRLTAPSPIDAPIDLAVSVNGIIQATTETYALPGENDYSSFSAMVSEAAMAPGRNLVTISLIEQVGSGEPALAPVSEGTTVTYSLRQYGDAPTAILGSDGRTFTIKPGVVRGEVHRNGETVKGFAADVAGGRPAESILVFSGQRFLFSADVWLPTPGIVERYGDRRLIKTGFRFSVPQVFLGGETEALEVYAVVGATATRIGSLTVPATKAEQPR